MKPIILVAWLAVYADGSIIMLDHVLDYVLYSLFFIALIITVYDLEGNEQSIV